MKRSMWILGCEEELNNHGRWVTHEGNAAITGFTKYADWNHTHLLYKYTAPIRD